MLLDSALSKLDECAEAWVKHQDKGGAMKDHTSQIEQLARDAEAKVREVQEDAVRRGTGTAYANGLEAYWMGVGSGLRRALTVLEG